MVVFLVLVGGFLCDLAAPEVVAYYPVGSANSYEAVSANI